MGRAGRSYNAYYVAFGIYEGREGIGVVTGDGCWREGYCASYGFARG